MPHYHKDTINFKARSDKTGSVLWEAKGHLHINSWTKEATSSKALKYPKQLNKCYKVSPINFTTILSSFEPWEKNPACFNDATRHSLLHGVWSSLKKTALEDTEVGQCSR